MVKPDIAPVDTNPAIIVFGRDRKGKPHASCFGHSEATLAQKAAALMSMQVLLISTDDHRSIAAQLPRGRAFSSGRAFVPLVRANLYSRIVELSQCAPLSESVEASAMPDSDPAVRVSAVPPTTSGLPCGWADIGIGSLVLATTAPMDGWYESVVVDAKGHDLFILKWRDWPDEPAFVRRRWHLGLLHPAGGG